MLSDPTLLPSDNPRVPAASHPFRHVVDLQTRFADIDMLGHVNNNVYFSFMDLGKIDYFLAVSGGRFSMADLKAVVVNVNCDFFEPSYFTEPLQVWTSVAHIGHRSFTIEQRVVSKKTGSTKCIGRTILAGFAPATRQGAPLDETFVSLTEQFEGISRTL